MRLLAYYLAASLLLLASIAVHRPAQHTPDRFASTTISRSRASEADPQRQATSLIAALDFVSPAIGWVALYSPRVSRAGNACDYDLSRTPVTILRTTDGGNHWTAQLHFTGDSTVSENWRLWGMWMRFVNARDGFVSGPATEKEAWMYRTQDGGLAWSKLRLPGIPGSFIGDPFSFPSASDGWLLADVQGAMNNSSANVFHTADGGSHWTLVAYSRLPSAGTHGFRTGGDKNAIVFRNASVGWVTAPSPAGPGLVYATTNGGKSWSFQNLAIPKRDLPKGFFSMDGVPYPPTTARPLAAYLPVIVHIDRTGTPRTTPRSGTISYLYLYSLAPDGVHWINPRLLPGTDNLSHPMYWQILDPQRWWVGAGNTLRRTVNGGRTWQTDFLHLPKGFLLTELDFVGPSRGWAIATAGYTPGYPACTSILLRTTDAGAHWTPVAVGG